MLQEGRNGWRRFCICKIRHQTKTHHQNCALSGEEQGLYGSREYVSPKNLADRGRHVRNWSPPKKFDVHFNLDNGTGASRAFIQEKWSVRSIMANTFLLPTLRYHHHLQVNTHTPYGSSVILTGWVARFSVYSVDVVEYDTRTTTAITWTVMIT